MVLGSGVKSRFKKGKGKCLIVFVLFCFIILGLDDANHHPLCIAPALGCVDWGGGL